MVKLLIGGSPCTYWSIAQKNNRETTAEGLGWELFKNYLIAKDKFEPDFFLYENNKSAAQAIKDQIKQELHVWDNTLFTEDSGARYIEINSALVSAQNRQRFYVHNCGDVKQPEDRGILLKDVLESGCCYRDKSTALAANRGGVSIEHDIAESRHTLVAESVLIPEYGESEKSRPVRACYAYKGCGEGSLVTEAFPSNPNKQVSDYIAEPSEHKNEPAYQVKDGMITIKGKQYPIKLADGWYYIHKLTVTECCRLQTMPADYCRAVIKTQAYKGLGNGWTAEVIIHILTEALKNIPKDEQIVVLSMYDGIGTGRYCLDKMGFTNVKYYAYEIDKYPIQIAKSNYPDIIECGDAFQLRNDEWYLGVGGEINV